MATRENTERRHTDAQYEAALKNFEAAARYFQKQQYDKAKELYEKLVDVPIPQIAERSRVHLRLCESKAGGRVAAPKTAEDYYNAGILHLNTRHLDLAIEHLSKADKMASEREHIRYALAAACALKGDTDAALDHLKAAIRLRRQNGTQARLDEDFRSLASDPRFRRLISGELD